MPLGGGGGGGAGGGGIILRTPVDMFNGATRTAAETARDAAITDHRAIRRQPEPRNHPDVAGRGHRYRLSGAPQRCLGRHNGRCARADRGASGRNGVDGTDGTDGGDGAPGGGALSLVGTATLTITGTNDDMFLAPGFRLAGYGLRGC